MKFLILLCLVGAAAASPEATGTPADAGGAGLDVAAGVSGDLAGGVAGALGAGGSTVSDAVDLVKSTSREKVSDYVPYLPPNPYDLSKIDMSKLGTVSKILTSVVDLVRGVLKGLEASVTSIYTVLIPTVRILLAGAKVKVCQPQSLLEITVWFVKELVNVQLYADLAVAQIPLCQQKKEELNPDGSDLSVWNITYEVPDSLRSQDQQAKEAAAAAGGEDGLLSGATALPGLGGAADAAGGAAAAAGGAAEAAAGAAGGAAAGAPDSAAEGAPGPKP